MEAALAAKWPRQPLVTALLPHLVQVLPGGVLEGHLEHLNLLHDRQGLVLAR